MVAAMNRRAVGIKLPANRLLLQASTAATCHFPATTRKGSGLPFLQQQTMHASCTAVLHKFTTSSLSHHLQQTALKQQGREGQDQVHVHLSSRPGWSGWSKHYHQSPHLNLA